MREIGEWEAGIIFGTDGEKALIKAIKSTFPNSGSRLCYLHLKKNVEKKMIVFLTHNLYTSLLII